MKNHYPTINPNRQNGGRHFSRRFFVCLLVALAASLTTGVAAQSDDGFYAERLLRGDAEQKREALLRIRNAGTAAASAAAVPALRDKSESVRAAAAFSVVYLPPDEAATVLLPNLRDKSAFVRRETAYALGATGSPNAVAPLIETFRRDKKAEVKNACIVALGTLGDAAAISLLTEVLRSAPKKDLDAAEFLRRAAARSVGQIAQILQTNRVTVVTPESFLSAADRFEPPRYADLSANFPVFRPATAELLRLLADERAADDVKREAAFALGAIGDAAAVPILQAHTTAADYYLAEICRRALQKIAAAKASERGL